MTVIANRWTVTVPGQRLSASFEVLPLTATVKLLWAVALFIWLLLGLPFLFVISGFRRPTGP